MVVIITLTDAEKKGETMRNYTDIDQLLRNSKRQNADLSIDSLAMLQSDIVTLADRAKAAKAALSQAVLLKTQIPIDQPGTFNEGAVKVEVKKNVSWDQTEMRSAEGLLRDWGEDPSEYIDAKLSVAEAKWKAWPEIIKKLFIAARTVRPSSPVVTIKQTEDAV
jgi:hypothetical protein